LVRTAQWVEVLLGYNVEGRRGCNYGGISGYYGGESAQVATNTRCSENPITKEKPECCSH
jgi:hypothetical protein